MIATNLVNIEKQIFMTPKIQRALEFLRRPDLKELPSGKIAIDDDRIFAIISRIETAPIDVLKFEAHRQYAEFHLVIDGEEDIAWAPLSQIDITESYSAEKDCCLGTIPRERASIIHLRAGDLAFFYPEDAHAPKLAADNKPAPLHKVVLKIAV